jgi:uncharacterized protein with GYD domain
MAQFAYTPQAWAALIRMPQDRAAASDALVRHVGGRLIGLYYTPGAEYDGFALFEAPDDTAAAAAEIADVALGLLAPVPDNLHRFPLGKDRAERDAELVVDLDRPEDPGRHVFAVGVAAFGLDDEHGLGPSHSPRFPDDGRRVRLIGRRCEIVEEQQGQGRAERGQQSRHDQVPLLPRRHVHETHVLTIGKVGPGDEAGLRANALAVREPAMKKARKTEP